MVSHTTAVECMVITLCCIQPSGCTVAGCDNYYCGVQAQELKQFFALLQSERTSMACNTLKYRVISVRSQSRCAWGDATPCTLCSLQR